MSDKLPDVEDTMNYDSETDTYRATFDSKTIDPSLAVVKGLASVCEKQPTELTPLGTIIDPNALDQILTTPASDPTGDRKVEFTFEEHAVTVMSYGLVKIQPVATADSMPEGES